MPDHQNKHIRESIKFAEQVGWIVIKAGPRAHLWGTLYCPQKGREGCRVRIMSTPRNPEAHARDIRRSVERCSHAGKRNEDE